MSGLDGRRAILDLKGGCQCYLTLSSCALNVVVNAFGGELVSVLGLQLLFGGYQPVLVMVVVTRCLAASMVDWVALSSPYMARSVSHVADPHSEILLRCA